jgi:hypothetical protein
MPDPGRSPGAIHNKEELIMQNLLGTLAAVALLCSGITAHAADSLSVGRQMLNEDNRGDLWIDTGMALFYQ